MMLARRAAFEMHPLPQPLSREGRGELHTQSLQDSAKFSGQRSKSPSPLAGEGLGRGGKLHTQSLQDSAKA